MNLLFKNYWWQLILTAIVSYAIGGINFATLFTKVIKHQDIRSLGSGNAGATNVFRVFGLRMGALTLTFDVLKGVVVCLLCMLLFKSTGHALEFEYWAGLFVVLGHILPVFSHFRGGKGVAASLGVCAVTQPLLTLYCLMPICVIIFIVDRMSVVSILFAVFMTVWHWVVLRSDVGIASCVFVSIMFASVVFSHRHNIVRIFTGKEQRTGVRRKLLRKDKRELKQQRLLEQQALLNAEELANNAEEVEVEQQ